MKRLTKIYPDMYYNNLDAIEMYYFKYIIILCFKILIIYDIGKYIVYAHKFIIQKGSRRLSILVMK